MPNNYNIHDEALSEDLRGNDAQAGYIGSTHVLSSDKIKMNNFVDLSDRMAFQGALIEINSLGSRHMASFKAYITAFNESFSCDWATETVFGRADPIQMFKQTTRNCTLGFKIPCATPSEAFLAMNSIEQLRACLYPNYESHNDALTISSSPLVRISVLNPTIINTSATLSTDPINSPYLNSGTQSTARNSSLNTYSELFDSDTTSIWHKGALAIIKNMQINYNLENADIGVFEGYEDPFETSNYIAKQFDITIDFTIIHEVNPGRIKGSGGRYETNYSQYNIDMPGSITAANQDRVAANQTRADAERAEEEAAQQAIEEQQQAGFFRTMVQDFRTNRSERRGAEAAAATERDRQEAQAASLLAQQIRAERIYSYRSERAYYASIPLGTTGRSPPPRFYEAYGDLIEEGISYGPNVPNPRPSHLD